MMRIKWIENILELKNKRTLLEKRYIFNYIMRFSFHIHFQIIVEG